ALRVFGFGCFLQLVTRSEHAVFRQPAARAPAAVRNIMLNCEIQRRAIHARLSAGNDFLNQKASPPPIRRTRKTRRFSRSRIPLAFAHHGLRLTTLDDYGERIEGRSRRAWFGEVQ